MDNLKLQKKLQEADFHLDEKGRIVIDNVELLDAVNGAALAALGMEDLSANISCSNSGC